MSRWTKALRARYDTILPNGPEALKRVAVVAAIVGGVVSALICLACTLFIVKSVRQDVQHQVQKATLKASQRNCLTQAAGRNSGNRTKFALRELLRFDTDILTSSARNPHQTEQQKRQLAEFLANERAHLLADYAVAKRTIPGLRRIESYADLQPLLANTPTLNCATALLTG